MKKLIILTLVLIMIALTFSACVPGDGTNTGKNPAGFFWGIWHGWLAPISLIIGIFNKSIRIYEIYNTGWWYDFGYYLAIIGGFGGFALSRKKK